MRLSAIVSMNNFMLWRDLRATRASIVLLGALILLFTVKNQHLFSSLNCSDQPVDAGVE